MPVAVVLGAIGVATAVGSAVVGAVNTNNAINQQQAEIDRQKGILSTQTSQKLAQIAREKTRTVNKAISGVAASGVSNTGSAAEGVTEISNEYDIASSDLKALADMQIANMQATRDDLEANRAAAVFGSILSGVAGTANSVFSLNNAIAGMNTPAAASTTYPIWSPPPTTGGGPGTASVWRAN